MNKIINKLDDMGKAYDLGRKTKTKEILNVIKRFEKDMHKDTSQSFIACWDIIKKDLINRIKKAGREDEN